MKLYRFDAEVGKSIDLFDSSSFVISKIVHLFEGAVIQCAHLGINGVIGYHQTTVHQLFLVVQGAGWVRGVAPDRTPITACQAAYWEKDEWHESGSESGMTVILIEGMKLNLTGLVPVV
jgi:hypothetical protein